MRFLTYQIKTENGQEKFLSHYIIDQMNKNKSNLPKSYFTY